MWKLIAWACLVHFCCVQMVSAEKMNVVFIMVDDLKNNLGVYNDDLALTPNIDALAGKGFTFFNMQTVKSECAPSRLSVLAGRRPDQLRVWAFEPRFRRYNRNLQTLPGLFRSHGYRTEAVGKLFDNRSFFSKRAARRNKRKRSSTGFMLGPDQCNPRKPRAECSWDWYLTAQDIFANTNDVCGHGNPVSLFPGFPDAERHWQVLHIYDDVLAPHSVDACIANVAIERMGKLSNNAESEPFFLGVGFALPHLPWSVPNTLWDHFASIDDSVFAEQMDDNNPRFWTDKNSAWIKYNNQELKQYNGWASTSLEDLARGYYASVSFVDQQIGRLMEAFGNLPKPTQDKTLVVFWGDHGFHIGDHGLWGKKTVLEQATRVPFFLVPPKQFLDHNPDIAANMGGSSNLPTDSVDIFPTIANISNVSTAGMELAGTSLVPLMRDPENGFVRAAAVSQYPSQRSRRWIGYSIRTTRYRFIVFVKRHNRFKNLRWKLAYSPRRLETMRLYQYAEAGDLEERNRIDDPEMKDVRDYFVHLFRSIDDRDWTKLVGEQPFDM